jgi:hypothetical protein
MTGLPEHNYPAFNQAAEQLRAKGYTVVTPTEVGNDLEAKLGAERFSLSYQAYMMANIIALLNCNAIVLLPGWRNSRGARLERHIAQVLGFDEFYYSERNGTVTPI